MPFVRHVRLHRGQRCLGAGWLTCLICLVGCASGSRADWGGAARIPADFAGPPADITALEPAGTTRPILIVVTYPATVAPEAVDRVTELLLRDERLKSADYTPAWAAAGPAGLDETLAKSTYYALEFYEVLRRRLPAGTVVLQPMQLRVRRNGSVEQAAAVDLPPHAMRVDVWGRASIARIATGQMRSLDSYGRSFLLSVNAFLNDPSQPPPRRHRLGRVTSRSRVPNTLAATLNDPDLPKGDGPAFPVRGQRPADAASFFLVTTGAQLEADARFAEPHFRSPRPDPRASPFAPVYERYANFLIEILTDAELAPLLDQQFLAYARDVRLPTGELALAKTLVDKERRFLVEQDEAFFQELYHGAFGEAVRTMLLTETQHDLALVASYRRQESLRQQQLYSMLAMSNALNASALALQGGAANAQVLAHQAQVMTGAVHALSEQGHSIQAAGRDAADLSRLVGQQLRRTRAAQADYVLRHGGSEVTIRADSLEGLRDTFRSIFSNRGH